MFSPKATRDLFSFRIRCQMRTLKEDPNPQRVTNESDIRSAFVSDLRAALDLPVSSLCFVSTNVDTSDFRTHVPFKFPFTLRFSPRNLLETSPQRQDYHNIVNRTLRISVSPQKLCFHDSIISRTSFQCVRIFSPIRIPVAISFPHFLLLLPLRNGPPKILGFFAPLKQTSFFLPTSFYGSSLTHVRKNHILPYLPLVSVESMRFRRACVSYASFHQVRGRVIF
ncbi:hypothetical protein DFH05DRAFT_327741 [Lentinula detonsa]|uniref:Uncharacterized protein n=1 Tax=Lentinula detonsa TaxID=2804962 RepID=A0A9W8TUL8_9AGAR|nr:hypothetical protein DFH05DRAFT_327741 [Lentinula detonsa]